MHTERIAFAKGASASLGSVKPDGFADMARPTIKYRLARSAESEVARCIALGQSVDHISARSGTSPNTVRSHLRKVLEKTQCSRQT